MTRIQKEFRLLVFPSQLSQPFMFGDADGTCSFPTVKSWSPVKDL